MILQSETMPDGVATCAGQTIVDEKLLRSLGSGLPWV
jgi:hypothetical protein